MGTFALPPEPDQTDRPHPPHGIADWPFGAAATTRPDSLPDGRPWPRIRVVTRLGPDDATRADEVSATAASVLAQGYAEARHDLVHAGSDGDRAVAALLEDGEGAFVLFLRVGDLLAPGALTALALEAALTGAEAVAGMRVLFDRGVHGVDGLAEAHLPADEPDEAPFTGGEVLLACDLVRRASRADEPLRDLFRRLAGRGLAVVRIWRPVLLQADPGGASRTMPRGWRIAALTDTGYHGGAGIAHRRLVEALALAGHDVVPMRLADESPPQAAEWTDRFPRTEATLDAGGYDLVLAGNLHGATRSLGVLGRIARGGTPVAAVLHDLFTLTGRCAHPKGCPLIVTGCDARCPTSAEYPQLAPQRIADAHAEKRAILGTEAGPRLLAGSDWAADQARRVGPPGTAVSRITLAFPTGVFRPGDRAVLRRELALPTSDVLVLFSAVIADAPDKGFADLRAALRRVAGPGVGFVALGRLDDPDAFGVPNLHAPGLVGDEAVLARWYAASDIVLTGSRLETLGQTPIEAGLCGTPSIAYRATGLTSAIVDGVTGCLVDDRAGALGDALAALIADAPRRRRLGAQARIVLESRFSHAASAASLAAALAGHAHGPTLAGSAGRIRFRPEMLARFSIAADRHPGEAGPVAAPSRALVRRLRRAKHAILGRGMPLWLRRALYAASLVRGARS